MNRAVRALEMEVLVGNRSIAGPARMIAYNGKDYTRVRDGNGIMPCGGYFAGIKEIKEMVFKKYKYQFGNSEVIIATKDEDGEKSWEYFNGEETWKETRSQKSNHQ